MNYIQLLEKTARESGNCACMGIDPNFSALPEGVEVSEFFLTLFELMDLDNKRVVYLGDAGLAYIKDEGDKLVIGSMTTMTELLECEAIDKVPVLKEALSQLAGLTVRNIARGPLICISCSRVPAKLAQRRMNS